MTYDGPSHADLESVLEDGEGYRRTGFGARRCPIPARISPLRCIVPARAGWLASIKADRRFDPALTTQPVSGAARQPSRSARLMLFLLTRFVSAVHPPQCQRRDAHRVAVGAVLVVLAHGAALPAARAGPGHQSSRPSPQRWPAACHCLHRRQESRAKRRRPDTSHGLPCSMPLAILGR
jgi:hypothetical protein